MQEDNCYSLESLIFDTVFYKKKVYLLFGLLLDCWVVCLCVCVVVRSSYICLESYWQSTLFLKR